ncbi:MAG: Gfo/Idh/MocA family oxidoreductase [Clostridia bacterium]|nr:Gfo/Idh/MocA family oxidoreductase [Clostridia bacterium]
MQHTLAIIGYGGMGGWHHKSIEEKVKNIRVKGAFDIRPEAMAKAREAGLHTYASVEKLLADKETDLITIATPNDVHRPLVIRCLEAGKNVVCEKPVALNAVELEDMIAASRRTGKLFSIHQNRRWDRDYRIVRETIRSGLIGNPYFIESRVQGSRGSMYGWRGYKQNGGGMLLDWGVHLIDQLMDMTPEPVIEVSACLHKIFGSEVDDNIKVSLRFGNGLSALLEMSTNCFINLPRWHISGTEGTLVINDWSCDGEIVKLSTDAVMEWDDDIVYTEAGPTRTMAPRPKHTTQRLTLPDERPDWSEYYMNIADTLDGKAELIVKPEQALRVMRVIDTVFAADEKRCGISCEI